ncbi:MAG: hypothetical protein JW703_04530 [Candidatus Diapherotrites archaeon]|nr:hypothetical protein [Candidatus Diapherotrites archaeon]
MGIVDDSSKKKRQKASLRKKDYAPLERAKKTGFPNCKGLYPDCPEKPSKDNPMCRSCPILDE